jgi:aspartyl-tRNA(Asn)/glutamyl-tRNA(Gln) amidotransferase subunit C
MLAFAMPALFTRDDVAKIAALAHLELDPAEMDLFARQLGEFLSYADAVQEVDTAGIAPTASVLATQAADRPDEPQPCLDRDEALANAPDAALDAGFFRVPRVIGA